MGDREDTVVTVPERQTRSEKREGGSHKEIEKEGEKPGETNTYIQNSVGNGEETNRPGGGFRDLPAWLGLPPQQAGFRDFDRRPLHPRSRGRGSRIPGEAGEKLLQLTQSLALLIVPSGLSTVL